MKLSRDHYKGLAPVLTKQVFGEKTWNHYYVSSVLNGGLVRMYSSRGPFIALLYLINMGAAICSMQPSKTTSVTCSLVRSAMLLSFIPPSRIALGGSDG